MNQSKVEQHVAKFFAELSEQELARLQREFQRNPEAAARFLAEASISAAVAA